MIRMERPVAFVCLLFCAQVLWAQTPEQPARQEQSEVVRVYTELVQTDVMVFDRQGRFANNLKKEDFELRIDGQPKPIEFFEKITAGSVSEESQLEAARGSLGRKTPGSPAAIPLDRGRPIFFYIDDLHLDLAGLRATQKLINHFLDKEMGQNDEAAIASATGQLGFLQQLTDNKTVLRAALERLKPRPYTVRDLERPRMTEYQALRVDGFDREVRDYFVDETMKNNPGMRREMAESMVLSRARALLQQSSYVTSNTLAGLEDLVRTAKTIPGRKLLFFIASGFFLDDRNSDTTYKLRRITSAAARSGVVIYSMDIRGLVASFDDASSESQFDPTGRLQRSSSGELAASQDGLNALAVDTGGKPFFNSNSLEPALGRALKETSSYYLLAWKPAQETQHASKFRRIEVKIAGKPELIVQVRRGFFDIEPEPPAAKVTKGKKAPEPDAAKKSPEADLKKVMFAAYPSRDIPVSLSLSYVNSRAKGIALTAALQVPYEFLSFTPANEKQTAAVDVAGTFFNDRGLTGASFNNHLTIDAPSIEALKLNKSLSYAHTVSIVPGLYQVRVGVRDEKSGRSGSAHAWIEIPSLSSGQLALSSLLIGARAKPAVSSASADTENSPSAVELSIAHNFSADEYLRFLVFIYNAALAPADSKPDVVLQVQVVRDDQPVITSPLKKVSPTGVPDAAGIPYAAEIPLAGLPAGRYLLKVTVVDRFAKRSASQQTRFEIE